MMMCPFCGSHKTKIMLQYKKIFRKKENGSYGWDYYVSAYVRCNKCHARGPLITGKQVDMTATKQEAEKRWGSWASQVFGFETEEVDSEDD